MDVDRDIDVNGEEDVDVDADTDVDILGLSLGCLGVLLELCLSRPGAILAPSWCVLLALSTEGFDIASFIARGGHLETVLELSRGFHWGVLETSWGVWDVLEASGGRLGGALGASWASWKRLGSVLEAS